jgi:hypothetical protein
MPVKMELCENDRVMYWVFTDPWEVADLTAHYDQAKINLDSALHKLHSLANVERSRRMPTGILQARKGPDWNHPNSGQVVLVGASPIIKGLFETIMILVHFKRVRMFDHEEEGWQYLRQLIAEENTEQEK